MKESEKIWMKEDPLAAKLIISFTLDLQEIFEGCTSITTKQIVIDKKLTLIKNYLDEFFSKQEQYQKNILNKIKEDL